MTRGIVIAVVLWCVCGTACTLATLDIGGFPCDSDAMCGAALTCVQGYCTKRSPEPPGETEPREASSEGRVDAASERPTEPQPKDTPTDSFKLPSACQGGRKACQLAQLICTSECWISAAYKDDATGALYVGGMYSQRLHTAQNRSQTSTGYSDAFLLKLSAQGTPEWIKSFGGAEESRSVNQVKSIALDQDGHVYALAAYHSTLLLEGNSYPSQEKRSGVLLVKYTSEGELAWHKIINGSLSDYAAALSLGPQGHVYALGQYGVKIEIDGVLLQGVSTGIFLASWKSDGTLRWAKSISTSAHERGIALAWSQGALWVAAKGFDALPASIAGKVVGTAGSPGERFGLLQFTAQGTLQKAHFSSGGGTILGSSFAASDDGTLYLASSIKGSHNMFGKPCGTAGEAAHLVVAKISGSGGAEWCRHTSLGDKHVVAGLLLDPRGNVVLGGHFQGEIKFNDAIQLKAAGGYDLFVAALDPKGSWQWALHGKSSKNNTLYALQMDGTDGLQMWAKGSGKMTFDAVAITIPDNTLFLWRLPLP